MFVVEAFILTIVSWLRRINMKLYWKLKSIKSLGEFDCYEEMLFWEIIWRDSGEDSILNMEQFDSGSTTSTFLNDSDWKSSNCTSLLYILKWKMLKTKSDLTFAIVSSLSHVRGNTIKRWFKNHYLTSVKITKIIVYIFCSRIAIIFISGNLCSSLQLSQPSNDLERRWLRFHHILLSFYNFAAPRVSNLIK